MFKEESLSIISKERQNRKIVGKYGIKFLDDILLGIYDEDFVLIGAETGHGKTELANEIAFRNADLLRVHLFSLESDKNEPIYRKMFKLLAEKHYSGSRTWKDFSYRNFIAGKLDPLEDEKEVIKELAKYEGKLTIHYRDKGDFSIHNLTQIMGKIKDSCDLIILDHLDYFDLTGGESENSQITDIMKTLRNINQVYGIPLIVFSHLRKKYDKKQLFPTIDDFMGSSNKAKIAKTVILMGRDFETEPNLSLYPTYCQVVKSRICGGGRMAGRVWFDSSTNNYSDEYELVKINSLNNSIENVPKEKYPNWAKNIDTVKLEKAREFFETTEKEIK